ncbi:hypothetical protein DUNSADRAFT_13291, partial [Dunaliella salina]
ANIERPTSQPASKRSRSINYKQLLDGSDEDERSADVSSEYVGSDDEEEEPCMKSKRKELMDAVDAALAAKPLNASRLQRLYTEAGKAKASALIGKRRHEKLHAALKNT